MRALFHDRSRGDLRRRSLHIRPIGYNDLCLAADVVAEVAPGWTVELTNGFPREASLVIMPEGADDLIGPTFIVYQERSGFRLDQFQWDTQSGLGEYASLRDAMVAVATCLSHLSDVSPACSALLH